jgi:hypothetical protein
MSKVAISGNASGTGTFTIAAPNSNSDRTITLPDEAGTVLTSASSLAAANLTGTVPVSRFPSGSVLQTIATYSDTKASTNTVNTFVELSTDYRVTLTPTSTSSMIVVNYYIPINITAPTGSSNCIKLLRGFRLISGGSKDPAVSSRGGASGSRFQIAGHAFRKLNGHDLNDQQAESFVVVDFPNTTSAVSYGFEYFQESSAASTDFFGRSNQDGSNWPYSSRIIIVAQEIAQ